MIMESPVYNRNTYDIQATVKKHADFIPKILATHALSGCDTVCASYGIGKSTAVKAAKKHSFVKIGYLESSISDIMSDSTSFMASCYGCASTESMTDCRRKQWAQRRGKSASAPKLCQLPPTTEGHLQNTLRAHHQLCNWYAAMEIDPPDINSLEYGYEADHKNKIVTPRPLPEGVRVAPNEILEKIRCGCAAAQPCKSGKCTCHNKKTPCTIFCGCSDGDNCCNPFKKQHRDDSDSEDDDEEI